METDKEIIEILQNYISKQFKGFPINEETQKLVEFELNDVFNRAFPKIKDNFYIVTKLVPNKQISFSTVYKQ